MAYWRISNTDLKVFLWFWYYSSQPSRGVPFADVRLPPVTNTESHTYTEGEEVEVSTVLETRQYCCLFEQNLNDYVCYSSNAKFWDMIFQSKKYMPWT